MTRDQIISKIQSGIVQATNHNHGSVGYAAGVAAGLLTMLPDNKANNDTLEAAILVLHKMSHK